MLRRWPAALSARFLPELVANRAAERLGALALADASRHWSWADLGWRVAAAAQQLGQGSVEAGDRVAVLAANSLEYIALVHAITRRGAVAVPMNVRLSPAEIAWQLRNCGAKLLVHDPAHLPYATLAEAALSIERVIPASSADVGATVVDTGGDPSALHSIIYTSGTTGRAKGVQLTHANHWWSAASSARHLDQRADDRWLLAMPLFHVGGLAIAVRGLVSGVPVLVHERFDPIAMNEAIDDGVTHVSVVAAMLQRLLDARGRRALPSTLRCVLLGGGPAPRPLLERCTRIGVPVAATYGLTEAASQVTTLVPDEFVRKIGTAGRPLPGTEVRIAIDGRPGASAVGEIIVRGSTVMSGYWHRPDETSQVLRDGWLHTGDIGSVDADGYLTVLDRRDDLIVSGGENVSPTEVEARLSMHPLVVEAGVVGADDARWGQVPVAAVVVHRGDELSAEALRAFCAEGLARYKVPVRIAFVDALPRSASGKLLRHALRATLRADG